MANTLAEVTPKLLAQGLLALRQQAIMARLVNRQYEVMAGMRGSTIDVPIPAAIAAQDVTPANTPPATSDIAPTSVAIPLDQWKEAPFYLSDKDLLEVMNGTIPMQASEAVKAIANAIDSYILTNMYKSFYGFAGAPGTTPFGTDLSEFKTARIALNEQLAPLGDRRVVLDPLAEGNATMLPNFLNVYQRGDQGGILAGEIGHKVGADWYMDQNVPTHVSTPLTAGAATINGAHAVGVKTVSIAKATNASDLVQGDVITFAGDTQTYVITTDVTLAVGNTNISIEPGLKVAQAGGAAMTLKASHVANLHFHRDAFAFATRPLQDSAEGLGNLITSAVDPVSGLTLRLEVSREHKRTRYSFDCLYGGQTVRRELGARIAG